MSSLKQLPDRLEASGEFNDSRPIFRSRSNASRQCCNVANVAGDCGLHFRLDVCGRISWIHPFDHRKEHPPLLARPHPNTGNVLGLHGRFLHLHGRNRRRVECGCRGGRVHMDHRRKNRWPTVQRGIVLYPKREGRFATFPSCNRQVAFPRQADDGNTQNEDSTLSGNHRGVALRLAKRTVQAQVVVNGFGHLGQISHLSVAMSVAMSRSPVSTSGTVCFGAHGSSARKPHRRSAQKRTMAASTNRKQARGTSGKSEARCRIRWISNQKC